MSQVIQGVSTDLADRLIAGDGLMVAAAENFDNFVQAWMMQHPSVMRDRIPKGKFPNFKGMSQKSNIFRGTLGPQSGLTEWSRIEQSRKETDAARGLDACTYNPQTYTWAYDSIDFTGVQTSWRSPAICAGDMQYLTEAIQQLGMIISAGSQVTDATMETFNREQYMFRAAESGRFIVLAEGVGLDYIDSTAARVTYNPYTSSNLTITRAIFEKISTLNFDILDLVHQYLSDQCPDSATSMDSGMPIFMLMLDLRDFEKQVLNTPELREDFRRAIPMRLIEGFNMGFKTYRGWAVTHDPRQARYAFSNFTGDNVTLARVNPRRATRAGIIGSIPESNPAYVTAEFGTAIVFLKDTLQLLVPAPINSLGSGMTFGPQPDFNGTWTWLNIADQLENPLNEKGYFFSRFRYFVKPLRYAQEITVLLYRRCVAALKKECPVVERSYQADDSASIAVAAVSADVTAESGQTGGTAIVKLAKPLSAGVGDRVTIAWTTGGAGSAAAWIVEDSDAPTYKLAWDHGTTGPAYTALDTAATVTVA